MFVIDASAALASLLGQPEAVLSDPLIVRMADEPALEGVQHSLGFVA